MIRSRRVVAATSLAAAAAMAMAGCASAAGGQGADDGRIVVATSTSVYGQVVAQIGGEAVAVTSIVSSASQDPHAYEASARDQLTVSRADLIVENGGGYDPFIHALIEASGTDAPVISAVEFSPAWTGDSAADSATGSKGDQDDHGDHTAGFNEHVWYDPTAMSDLAAAVATQLAQQRPADAPEFEANLDEFREQIDGLTESVDDIAASAADAADAAIFVTEPAPLYLTEAAGLDNVAPDAFSEAVEEGQDVAPATLLESLELLDSGDIRMVIGNAQTGGAETEQIVDAAERNGIPVLEFTETLPDGSTYVQWMKDNIDALAAALAT